MNKYYKFKGVICNFRIKNEFKNNILFLYSIWESVKEWRYWCHIFAEDGCRRGCSIVRHRHGWGGTMPIPCRSCATYGLIAKGGKEGSVARLDLLFPISQTSSTLYMSHGLSLYRYFSFLFLFKPPYTFFFERQEKGIQGKELQHGHHPRQAPQIL